MNDIFAINIIILIFFYIAEGGSQEDEKILLSHGEALWACQHPHSVHRKLIVRLQLSSSNNRENQSIENNHYGETQPPLLDISTVNKLAKCSDRDISRCTDCAVVKPSHDQQWLPALVAPLFDIRTPAAVRRDVLFGGQSRETSILNYWMPSLWSGRQGQRSQELAGLDIGSFRHDIGCYSLQQNTENAEEKGVCSLKYPLVSNEDWIALRWYDFVMQNDDRLDTSYCGLLGAMNVTSFEASKRRSCASTEAAAKHGIIHMFFDDDNKLWLLDTDFKSHRTSPTTTNWNMLYALDAVPKALGDVAQKVAKTGDRLASTLQLAITLQEAKNANNSVPKNVELASNRRPDEKGMQILESLKRLNLERYLVGLRTELAVHYISSFSAFRNMPKEKVAFPAIPKVGGTTLESRMKERFNALRIFSFTHTSPEWRSCRKGPECDAMVGHATVSTMRSLMPHDRTVLLSFFREPIARSLSSYNYYYRSGKWNPGRYHFVSLKEYAEMPRWCNVQTRYLAGDLSAIHSDADGENRLKKALENLATKIDIVALQEHYDESLSLLDWAWNTTRFTLRANTNAERENAFPNRVLRSESDMTALRECDKYDLRLFEHIKKRFIAQRAACETVASCPQSASSSLIHKELAVKAITASPETAWPDVGNQCNDALLSGSGAKNASRSNARTPSRVGVLVLPRHGSSATVKQLKESGIPAYHEQSKAPNSSGIFFDFHYGLPTSLERMNSTMSTYIHAVLDPIRFARFVSSNPLAPAFLSATAIPKNATTSLTKSMWLWLEGHRRLLDFPNRLCFYHVEELPLRFLCKLSGKASDVCNALPLTVNQSVLPASAETELLFKQFSWDQLIFQDPWLASEVIRYAQAFNFFDQ